MTKVESGIINEEQALGIINELIVRVELDNPTHSKFVRSALGYLTCDEKKYLAEYLNFCLQQGLSMDYISHCYLTIVEDTIREQIYFMKHKRYRYEHFSDISGNVYFNQEYMARYMYGLAITSFLWPNHIDIIRFFQKKLPNNRKGIYLEVGPGHGYYFMTALRLGRYDKYIGIDISKESVKQTIDIISYFNPQKSDCSKIELVDFLENDDFKKSSLDAIVMGEVLEHVEAPQEFLSKIAQLAKPDAFIFITTCLNSPAIDHIYLWRTTEELENMICGSDLEIRESLYLPYEGMTLDETFEKSLPVNVAYVLKKANQ